MAKTLEEQIANKCVHFTGIMDKVCRAGVNYDDFRGEKRPFRFPCLKQGGDCSKAKFPTPEEVAEKVDALRKMEGNGLKLYLAVKQAFEQTKQRSGKIQCPCGGEASFMVAEYNNHIAARCFNCGLSFQE